MVQFVGLECMINIQLGRRNLPPQQRIAVVKKFEKKIQDQAKAKLIESGKLYGENHPKDKSLSPNGETLLDRKIHTDKELAKMAGVGTGTIARFNKVMNSDDEELKKKVLANEVSINAGYKEIKQKENNKIDTKLNMQKEAINKEEFLTCSTCNYKNFENKNGKLEQSLGMGSLVIRCDMNGKNYRLAVNDESKSEYVLYWCPTCGSKLY